MEQHPIPRQITTFEFKLIGFMTLKQFIYLVVFVPLGFIVYKIFPIPLLNILFALVVNILGVALAFVPVNDRPLDVWIKNFIKRITSATQYIYKKQNLPLNIFQDLYFVADPHRVMAHIESQKKLSAYLKKTHQVLEKNQKKQIIQKFLEKPTLIKTNPKIKGITASPSQAPATTVVSQPVMRQSTIEKQPFFIGTVKNNRKIPLPGILIYVKNQTGDTIRLLKTNPHGIFATYSPLLKGEYFFETKDPKNMYFFDTIKIRIEETNPRPFEFFSKELM